MTRPVERLAQPITGGCQCGAVRYAAWVPLQHNHYCHCRMCQRATGNAFALLAGVPKGQLEWTRGEPSFYASSTVAQRGFCQRCGTPLTFAYHEGPRLYVTIGSLDDPGSAPPLRHFGIESLLPWLHIQDDLPREPTLDAPLLRTMTVHQHIEP